MAVASTVTFSKFIEGKIRMWYKMYNLKRDGGMGKEDFDYMTDVFIREFKPTAAQEAELRHWLHNHWSIIISEGKDLTAAGKPGGITQDNCPDLLEVEKILKNEQRITEDQYVKAFGQLVEVNKDLFVKTFTKMVTMFFNMFDADSDGFITVDDMIKGFNCFGIKHDDATRAIFNDLDKNKTGKVSRDLYLSEWIEFMVGENKDAVLAKYLCQGQS
ncbi:uncharacterized protein LOC132546526 [Ylistrum balloti]|uniref:uncharacterized protein LOC132546526 n=1 Tax=Ylistrum balloti TaxID=509963 RepID=UPI0029057DE3|nr:uncharacterized protein LOC132546526 [Ylistrum balloti]